MGRFGYGGWGGYRGGRGSSSKKAKKKATPAPKRRSNASSRMELEGPSQDEYEDMYGMYMEPGPSRARNAYGEQRNHGLRI
jgi:hypothetical protein